MRFLTLITFLSLAVRVVGQNNATENITTVQAGTATIAYGKATITLNQATSQMLSDKNNISASYYVSITPLCNCGQFYISEKGNDSFTIEQSANSNSGEVRFDYIVYVKQISIPASSSFNANMQRSFIATPNK